ncbi:MAG TPA: ribonuclease HI, partial [Thermoplasmata archaeon]
MNPGNVDEQIPRGTTVVAPIVTVHFDGACQPPRGGVATYGFVVEGDAMAHEESGPAVAPGSPRATNNIAEYVGAIRALEWLKGRGFRGTVLLCGDSQLVIRQMQGEYAVRADHLQQYYAHLQALVGAFGEVRFIWVPREENRRADELSKEALEEVRGGR